jgi:hypothetical protein
MRPTFVSRFVSLLQSVAAEKTMSREPDPFDAIHSNPTLQARRLLDERRQPRRGSDWGTDSNPPDEEMDGSHRAQYVEEQNKRIASLEHEIADMKKRLMDALYDKQTLEKDKADLQRLVEELSGGAIADLSAGGVRDDAVADRAKSTILALRLKRLEQKRAMFIDYVRTQGRVAAGAARKTKATLTDLKTTVQDQMSRMQVELSDSAVDLESIVEAINKTNYSFQRSSDALSSSMNVGDTTSTNNAAARVGAKETYFGAVSAAVQHQHKNVVLTADHPLIQRLGVLYTTIDGAVEALNAVWRDQRCFTGGRAPSLLKPRRYIDSLTNVNNYIAQAEKIKSTSGYVHSVQKLHYDLRLPNAMRHSYRAVGDADAALRKRTEEFFESLRVTRTSVVIKVKNLATAMRVFASCDAVRTEAAKIYAQYSKLSKQHTMRVLTYMANLIRYGRTPTLDCDYDLVDTKTNALEVADKCSMCTAPVCCEDCFRVTAVKNDKLRVAYERHRDQVTTFTMARLEHFRKLMKLVDDAVKILVQARLVPLDTIAGLRVGDQQVDQLIRKPQPPSSVNFFTRLRKSQSDREKLARGETLDDSPPTEGLAVAPLTLEEKRTQLLRMVASTQLQFLPHAEFAPTDLEGAVLGSPHSLGELHTPRGTSPRVLPSSARHQPPRSRGGQRPPTSPSAELAAAVTARRIEEHLPELVGPRSAQAAVRHSTRLDAVRRHNTQLATHSPFGHGGGPGSPQYGCDVRHGFITHSAPRTLTERILGPEAPQSPR